MRKKYDIGIKQEAMILDPETIGKIWELVINEGFVPYSKLRINDNDAKDEPINLTKVYTLLETKNTVNLKVLINDDFVNVFSFNKGKLSNTIYNIIETIHVPDNKNEHICQFTFKLACILPSFIYATIDRSPGADSNFYFEHGIDIVPSDCFNLYPGWWHLLHPSTYSIDFDREELLKTPAYRIFEHPNGIIEMQVWEDPFDIENPENIRQLKNVNEYLCSIHKTMRVNGMV